MPDPMYRQIADGLRQKIESGQLARGAQLPTELDLREEYDASRNTVRDAVKWLITRGLVETRPGQGTFVVQKIDPFVTRLCTEPEAGYDEGAAYASEVAAGGRTPRVSVPRIEIQQAEGRLAEELQLQEGATVVSRHQQRYIDNTPSSLQTTFYPMTLVEQGAAELLRAVDMPSAVRYLEEVLHKKQIGWREQITVRAPDAMEAIFFKLPDNGRVTVFAVVVTAFEESGTPLRVTVTVYPVDRTQFVLYVGDVPARTAEPDDQVKPDEDSRTSLA
jgi:GntR family transcriptional regulator